MTFWIAGFFKRPAGTVPGGHQNLVGRPLMLPRKQLVFSCFMASQWLPPKSPWPPRGHLARWLPRGFCHNLLASFFFRQDGHLGHL